MLTILCAVALAAQGHKPHAAGAAPQTWMVLLERTKVPWPIHKKEAALIEDGHAANLRKLSMEKRVLSAGRVRDAGGPTRESIVLLADGPKGVQQCFAKDPLVQQQVMHVDPFPIQVRFGHFNPAEPAAKGMEKRYLVLYGAGSHPAAVPSAHGSFIRRGSPANKLLFYATTVGSGFIREMAFFSGDEDKPLLTWLKSDPAVKSGALRVYIYPDWFLKGVL